MTQRDHNAELREVRAARWKEGSMGSGTADKKGEKLGFWAGFFSFFSFLGEPQALPPTDIRLGFAHDIQSLRGDWAKVIRSRPPRRT